MWNLNNLSNIFKTSCYTVIHWYLLQSGFGTANSNNIPSNIIQNQLISQNEHCHTNCRISSFCFEMALPAWTDQLITKKIFLVWRSCLSSVWDIQDKPLAVYPANSTNSTVEAGKEKLFKSQKISLFVFNNLYSFLKYLLYVRCALYSTEVEVPANF